MCVTRDRITITGSQWIQVSPVLLVDDRVALNVELKHSVVEYFYLRVVVVMAVVVIGIRA